MSIPACFYFEVNQFRSSCFPFKFQSVFQQKHVFFLKIELKVFVTRKLNQIKFRVKKVIDKQRIAVYDLWPLLDVLMMFMPSPTCFWFICWNLTFLCHCVACTCFSQFSLAESLIDLVQFSADCEWVQPRKAVREDFRNLNTAGLRAKSTSGAEIEWISEFNQVF